MFSSGLCIKFRHNLVRSRPPPLSLPVKFYGMKRDKWLKLPGLINETTKISPIKSNLLREKPCFVFPGNSYFIYGNGPVFIFSF
jgi:hypothetical protein